MSFVCGWLCDVCVSLFEVLACCVTCLGFLDVGFNLYVVCFMVCRVRRLLFVVGCMLFGVRLFVVRCPMFVFA